MWTTTEHIFGSKLCVRGNFFFFLFFSYVDAGYETIHQTSRRHFKTFRWILSLCCQVNGQGSYRHTSVWLKGSTSSSAGSDNPVVWSVKDLLFFFSFETTVRIFHSPLPLLPLKLRLKFLPWPLKHELYLYVEKNKTNLLPPPGPFHSCSWAFDCFTGSINTTSLRRVHG